MTHPSEPQPTSPFAAFLSFLVPGLGQIYQGRVGKGLLFFFGLLGLFHLGQWMGNWQNVYVPPPNTTRPGPWANPKNALAGFVLRWHYPGQFWIGVAAWPALWQFYHMPMPDAEKYPRLNKYQREPDENEVNRFIQNSDHTPDLGLMYTVIAGVLNILVIYDAYAGAAFPPLKKPKPRPAEEPAV